MGGLGSVGVFSYPRSGRVAGVRWVGASLVGLRGFDGCGQALDLGAHVAAMRAARPGGREVATVSHPGKPRGREAGDARRLSGRNHLALSVVVMLTICHDREHTLRNVVTMTPSFDCCDIRDSRYADVMSMTAIAAPDAQNVNVVMGERVHQLMWRAGITQTALAPILGLGQTGLSHKLRGKRAFAHDEILYISDIFGVSLDYLYGKTNDPRPVGPNGDRLEVVDPGRIELPTSCLQTGWLAPVTPIRGEVSA